MEINEIVELDLLADSIEQQAIEKGYSDSDQHRWKVAEEVTRRLESGLSQRELASIMSKAGEKKYDSPWVHRNRQVWINFGGAVVTTAGFRFWEYVEMIKLLPKGDFDAILAEASRTGLSPATIAKRIVAENHKAKEEAERKAKEAAEQKKREAEQKRIEKAKESIKPKPKPNVEEEKIEDTPDDLILTRWASDLNAIKTRSLNLIDSATELNDNNVRIDVRLSINEQIDELINILQNTKLIVNGIDWNSNGN